MIIGGAPTSTPTPLQIPSNTSRTVGQSKSSGAGAPGWAELGAASHALVGDRQIWAASEGSLFQTVVGNLDTERSWMRGEVWGEHECAGKGGGGGSEIFVRENHNGIQRHDLEIGIGGLRFTRGRLIWRGLRTGLE